MNKKLLRTSGVVALTAAVAALAMVFTPFGQFLQSSLIQSLYAEVDSGIYIGQERTENAEKMLRAQQGVTLRSESTKDGNTDFVTVYVKTHTENATFQADSFKAVLDYDRSRLSLENVPGGALSTIGTANTVDEGFSKILKDSSGNETGTLYFGVNKATEFTKPSEEVMKIKFRLLSGAQYADITMKTLRMYKRSDLLDTTNPTLYLNKGETPDTVAEKLTVTLAGTSTTSTEVATNDGGKVRTEIFKSVDNTTLKTVVTTYDASGKILKQETTLANGDKETRTYTYLTDGSYSVVIVSKIGTTTTTLSESYDGSGKLKSRDTGVVTTSETTTTATGTKLPTTTGGVTTAVNSTTDSSDTNVNTSPATTSGTSCTLTEGQRFNDVVGHWSESVVERARQKCIISGKALGRFAPDEPVTRAELTKIAVEAFKVAQNQNGSIGFLDVSDSEWYATYIRAAKLAEIVSGYNDGTFKPNASVNRAEALKIILEAGVKTQGSELGINLDGRFTSWMTQNPTYTYVRFPDVKIADWFSKYVLSGSEKGVVSGYNDRGTDVFRPGQPVTRAEAVKMIMSIIE